MRGGWGKSFKVTVSGEQKEVVRMGFSNKLVAAVDSSRATFKIVTKSYNTVEYTTMVNQSICLFRKSVSEGLEYEHHKRDKHMETCFLCVIFGSIWIGLQNQLILKVIKLHKIERLRNRPNSPH